jgi:hypothetical protein
MGNGNSLIHFIRLLILPTLVLGCGGCGKNKEFGSTLLNMVNSQCLASLSGSKSAKTLTAALSVSEIESVCKNKLNYRCSTRIFSPDVSNSLSQETQCTGFEPLGKPCLGIETHRFSTAHMLQRAPSSSFEEGGDYNKSEYMCHNESVGVEAALILGEGSNLDSALSSAYTKCLNVRSEREGSGS